MHEPKPQFNHDLPGIPHDPEEASIFNEIEALPLHKHSGKFYRLKEHPEKMVRFDDTWELRESGYDELFPEEDPTETEIIEYFTAHFRRGQELFRDLQAKYKIAVPNSSYLWVRNPTSNELEIVSIVDWIDGIPTTTAIERSDPEVTQAAIGLCEKVFHYLQDAFYKKKGFLWDVAPVIRARNGSENTQYIYGHRLTKPDALDEQDQFYLVDTEPRFEEYRNRSTLWLMMLCSSTSNLTIDALELYERFRTPHLRQFLLLLEDFIVDLGQELTTEESMDSESIRMLQRRLDKISEILSEPSSRR